MLAAVTTITSADMPCTAMATMLVTSVTAQRMSVVRVCESPRASRR